MHRFHQLIESAMMNGCMSAFFNFEALHLQLFVPFQSKITQLSGCLAPLITFYISTQFLSFYYSFFVLFLISFMQVIEISVCPCFKSMAAIFVFLCNQTERIIWDIRSFTVVLILQYCNYGLSKMMGGM